MPLERLTKRRVFGRHTPLKSAAHDNEQKNGKSAAAIVAQAACGRSLGAVLDVGTGVGAVLEAARPLASSMVGVDIDDRWTTEFHDRLAGVQHVLGSVSERLPFEGGCFDTIFFCDVIEHLDAPLFALEELRRLLAPSGRLVVTTPNADCIVRKVMGKKWYGLADPTHNILFSAFTLDHLIERAGLAVDRKFTLNNGPSALLDQALVLFGNGGTLGMIAHSTR